MPSEDEIDIGGNNDDVMDIGLQTPSSFTHTPSWYMRMTPSQAPGYLLREGSLNMMSLANSRPGSTNPYG